MTKPKAYKIIMSKGDPIPVDENELNKVADSIKSGQPRILRQGIFNPSFYVSIIADQERIKEFWQVVNDWEKNLKFDPKRPEPEFKQLKDIFEDTILRLGEGSRPQLKSGE